MIRNIVWAVLFVSLAATAQAQSVTPSSRLSFDIAAPNLADASGYAYKYYPDGTTTGIALTPVTCAGPSSPYICSAPFPAFTPGSHTLTITATNIAGESGKSTVLAFTFVVVPSAPTNPRIQ